MWTWVAFRPCAMWTLYLQQQTVSRKTLHFPETAVQHNQAWWWSSALQNGRHLKKRQINPNGEMRETLGHSVHRKKQALSCCIEAPFCLKNNLQVNSLGTFGWIQVHFPCFPKHSCVCCPACLHCPTQSYVIESGPWNTPDPLDSAVLEGRAAKALFSGD